MEPEAEALMHDGMAKNYIDYEEYPATCEIQNKCVAMIGNLFNVPKAKEGEEPMFAFQLVKEEHTDMSGESRLSDLPKLSCWPFSR